MESTQKKTITESIYICGSENSCSATSYNLVYNIYIYINSQFVNYELCNSKVLFYVHCQILACTWLVYEHVNKAKLVWSWKNPILHE